MLETKRWKLGEEEAVNQKIYEEALDFLRAGELVAFPTETVYGLGADATQAEAVAKIFQAKGRPQDNPLIVHVAKKEQLLPLVKDLSPVAEKLIDHFSPGPITYILPHSGLCAENVTAGLSTIAVRIPEHPIAQELLTLGAIPLAAPSANLSGKPSPTTADHVYMDLSGKLAGIIDGGPTRVGMESTVLDLTKEDPIVLRPGAITADMIAAVLKRPVHKAGQVQTEQPLSPGMKYPHYAPEVPLILASSQLGSLQDLIDEYRQAGNRVGLLGRRQVIEPLSAEKKVSLGENLEDVARNLYHALRSFQRESVDVIVCESYPAEGLGEAIMNRLQKAATRVK